MGSPGGAMEISVGPVEGTVPLWWYMVAAARPANMYRGRLRNSVDLLRDFRAALGKVPS